MNVVDNMTTRKDNKKHKTTNITYDQNSISIINKIITKSNSNQINSKQNNLTYTYLEKIRNLFSMRLVNSSNSSNKAEKQMFAAETIIDIKLQFTGNEL